VRAAERLTPESLQREPLAQLARYLAHYMMTGMGTMIKRGQELGLIRTDLPTELLMAWFRGIDSASDDWLLAHLDQLKTSRNASPSMRESLPMNIGRI